MKAYGSIPVDDEWLERARQDLQLAALALGADLVAGAAFHIQQALEKGLKALLMAEGMRPPRTHDLEALAASLATPPTAFTAAELAEASAWALSGRYPGMDEDLPSTARVGETLRKAQAWLKTLAP